MRAHASFPILGPAPQPVRQPVPRPLLLRFIVRETLGTAVLGAALLLAAGRVDWWAAWALVAVTGGWAFSTGLAIVRTRPDLLGERLGHRPGTPRWDRVLMSVVGMLTLARLVVAGLDERFGWSADFTLQTRVLGLLLCGAAYALVVWAVASNPWFASSARLQPDRAQAVANSGPYAVVRHPAYLASIVVELGACLLLGSWWALVPAGAVMVLFVVRTAKEDAALRAGLEGYRGYAAQVRHRLLPGFW